MLFRRKPFWAREPWQGAIWSLVVVALVIGVMLIVRELQHAFPHVF